MLRRRRASTKMEKNANGISSSPNSKQKKSEVPSKASMRSRSSSTASDKGVRATANSSVREKMKGNAKTIFAENRRRLSQSSPLKKASPSKTNESKSAVSEKSTSNSRSERRNSRLEKPTKRSAADSPSRDSDGPKKKVLRNRKISSEKKAAAVADGMFAESTSDVITASSSEDQDYTEEKDSNSAMEAALENIPRKKECSLSIDSCDKVMNPEDESTIVDTEMLEETALLNSESDVETRNAMDFKSSEDSEADECNFIVVDEAKAEESQESAPEQVDVVDKFPKSTEVDAIERDENISAELKGDSTNLNGHGNKIEGPPQEVADKIGLHGADKKNNWHSGVEKDEGDNIESNGKLDHGEKEESATRKVEHDEEIGDDMKNKSANRNTDYDEEHSEEEVAVQLMDEIAEDGLKCSDDDQGAKLPEESSGNDNVEKGASTGRNKSDKNANERAKNVVKSNIEKNEVVKESISDSTVNGAEKLANDSISKSDSPKEVFDPLKSENLSDETKESADSEKNEHANEEQSKTVETKAAEVQLDCDERDSLAKDSVETCIDLTTVDEDDVKVTNSDDSDIESLVTEMAKQEVEAEVKEEEDSEEDLMDGIITEMANEDEKENEKKSASSEDDDVMEVLVAEMAEEEEGKTQSVDKDSEDDLIEDIITEMVEEEKKEEEDTMKEERDLMEDVLTEMAEKEVKGKNSEDDLMEDIIVEMAKGEGDEVRSRSKDSEEDIMDDVLLDLAKEDKNSTDAKSRDSEDDLMDGVFVEMAAEDSEQIDGQQTNGDSEDQNKDDVAMDVVLVDIDMDKKEIDKCINDFLDDACLTDRGRTRKCDGDTTKSDIDERRDSVSSVEAFPSKSETNVAEVVPSVLRSLVNIINLQFEQEQCSEKIAKMESILCKKDSNKVLMTSKSRRGADKRRKCSESSRRSESSLSSKDSVSDATIKVAGNKSNDSSLEVMKIIDDAIEKVSNDLNGTDLEEIAASEQLSNSSVESEATSTHDAPNEVIESSCSKTKNSDISMEIDSDSSGGVETVCEISADSLPQSQSQTNVFLPLHVLQSMNDNSSDSEKSALGKLRLEENVQEIIESLRSPKADSSAATSDVELETCNPPVPPPVENGADETDVKLTSEGVEPEDEKAPAPLAHSLSKPENTVKPDDEKTDSVEAKPSAIQEMDVTVEVEPSSSKSVESVDEKGAELREAKMEDEKLALNGYLAINGFGCNSAEEALNALKEETEKKAAELFSDDVDFVEIEEEKLDEFVKTKVEEFFHEKFGKLIEVAQSQLALIKQEVNECVKYNQLSRSQLKEMAVEQNVMFRKTGYNTKVEKRTVGVNVRIVHQPCESKDNKNEEKKKPELKKPAPTQQQQQQSKPSPSATSKTLPTTQTPVKTMPAASGSPSQQTKISPPVTLVLTSTTPVPSTNPRSTHHVVDLTDDDSPRRAAAAAAAKVTTQSSPKPAGAPTNVLPIMTTVPSMVQLVPSGTNVRSGAEPIRMIRQTPLLPQGARFTYLVPQTPGALPVMPQLAGRGAGGPTSARPIATMSTQQSPGPRQNLQTFILAPMGVMTTSTPSGTVVTRSATLPPTTPAVTVTPSVGPASTSLVKSGQVTLTPCFSKHPAPLPDTPKYPFNAGWKAAPPKPSLKMNKVSSGIVLSWNMGLSPMHAEISAYQLYAYQENAGPVSPSLWKKVGDIKALPLPMACTLTQFVEGHKYHFTVRAVDIHKRCGAFSDPASILLVNRQKQGSSSQGKQ